MHNYAYSSCNLFISYDITTYLILLVVYGFYLLLHYHRSWMFLGVVETVVGSLLCCDMDIVQCLFSFCITSLISWLHHLQYQETTQILEKSFTPSHHQTFLLFFHILLPWRKGFLQMCANRATTKETKTKSLILKVNPIRPWTWVATGVLVVIQFYPWFQFYFPLLWGMVMYDNEFKTKGYQ